MKLTFWLLDVNYEVKDGTPALWLWGIDASAKTVLLIDRSFPAYFHALMEEHADPAKIVEAVESEYCGHIMKLEAVDRKFFGKPVRTMKVYCKNPDDIPDCSKDLRVFEGIKDCFEDDIRYSMRYLIDNNVVPCGWHEVDVMEEKDDKTIKVDKIYAVKSPPRLLEKPTIPPLRILGFSIICYNKEGSPKPDKNPVVMISVRTNSSDEQQFLTDGTKNDKPILEAFTEYVRNFDPDIIIGYGVNGQDWPYLTERCKQLGLKLLVGRTETEPHRSVFSHVSLTGRINLDLADYAEEFSEVKVKTLESMADFLGTMKLENRRIIEDVDFADYWDDEAKREVLKQFSMDNVKCVMGITEHVLDFAMQLSSLVSLPLDHVGTAAAGFRVEWFLIKNAHKTGELIPKRLKQAYKSYAGGLVLQPKAGLLESVAVLDFKSMYPNIMIAYNLSPDTYVPPEEPAPPGGVFEVPEVKHRFKKEPAGFYKEALSYLITVRDEIHLKMRKTKPTSIEYRVLNARQKAIKIITNAAYGYAGWTGARWYTKPIAEAAAALGRYTISSTIKMAKDEGLSVVYGDTDSIFVVYEPDKIVKLSKEIEKKLGLEIRPDKVYTRVFFTEAKKRYAGLLTDGRLDIVGLEAMRGDWAGVAKNVQEKVLETILQEQSPKKATELVQQFVYNLRHKLVSYRDLIIWKTLTRPPEEYRVKASHVEAAKMLRAKGWELSMGDKVGYVVVVGSGHLYERVKPYVFATYDDVDIEYYVSKQILPAAERILESFGVTEKQLLKPSDERKRRKSLSDFFDG